MPRWAETAEIAGVVFTGCRAEILDGTEFASPYRGSVDWGNDGTADAQIVNVGVRGNSFGVSLLSNEVDKVKDVLTAINSALAVKEAFVVHVVDEMYNINVYAVPDFNQKWFDHGKFSEGWLEDIIFRFISRGTV